LKLLGRLVATFVLLVVLWLPRIAHGADLPIIVAGRENEIVALVQPHFGTGKEIAPGYALGDVDVQPHAIRFRVNGPNGRKGALLLEHPSAGGANAEKASSFAVTLEGESDPAMAAVLRALLETIRTNDKGAFWPSKPLGPPTTASRFAQGPGSKLLSFRAPVLLRDGVLILLAALAFVALHVRRALRSEPRSILWSLLGLVALGAVIRLAIAEEAAMNVWPYERVVPLARAAFEGAILPAATRALHVRIYLTDVIFKTTAILAIVTPLAFFAHARYVLRDARGALFAVALLVLLPNHIRFARADSEFIQSLATSSLTFVVLYTALRDQSRAWRSVCFALLPLFSVATYFVRPENMFFWFVDVGAILLTSGDEAPRARKVFALVEVTLAAAFAFVVHLLAQYQSALQHALSLRTLTAAITLFFDVRLNTLINPSITPPGLTLLAVLGAVFLYRRGERGRALFLVSWLLGFFVVHSFVRPSEPTMQARYHMHLITPLLLLAASALPEVTRWPRRVVIAGAVYFALSPLVHLRFERDTNFNEMHEFSFMRSTSRGIPDECTVIEFSPAVGLSDPNHRLASRLERMAMRLDNGYAKSAFRVVNAGYMRDGKMNGEPFETLSDEVLEVLRKPPPCLMVYEGITCRSHRPPGTAIAPVCDELRDRFDLQLVATTMFKSRIYDEVQAGRMLMEPSGETRVVSRLRAGEDIPLMLYRATPKPR